MSAQTSLPQCARNLPDNDGDSVGQALDVDKDNDGLIEICDLDGLNEMRYQLNGTGYKTTDSTTVEAITMGCRPNGGCDGYELTKDLDFMDDTSYRSGSTNQAAWTSGEGWEPMGTGLEASLVFNGNGYTISNLRINRPNDDYIGFFEGFAGRIDNMRLKDVNVTGGGFTGGLAGANFGTINNGYVSGTITGTDDNVGGLVGENRGWITNSYAIVTVSGPAQTNRQAVGGLVGLHTSRIIRNSFVIGDVTGNQQVGGLVGFVKDGEITDSYARGSVSAATTTDIGGLVGLLNAAGPQRVNNSYSIAEVAVGTTATDIGGLVGRRTDANTFVNNSYWNTETSGQNTSNGGTSKTTMALQEPTTNEGIYASWSTTHWDFGSAEQYPFLRYIVGPDTSNPACYQDDADSGKGLPKCGDVLTDQDNFLPPCTALLTYTDNDGITQARDVDKDNDGLIEICDVEGLNTMRYQLDGSGYNVTDGGTAITTGCPSSGCNGYELTKDLDFGDTASYRSGSIDQAFATNWDSVGSGLEVTLVFNGNGYTISDLLINRQSENFVGFFEGFAGRIDNIRLENVRVTGGGNTGGLAGVNYGIINNAYVSGTIEGFGGKVGGIVGENRRTITNSQAIDIRVIASSAADVGGLVGKHEGFFSGIPAIIRNSFAVTEEVNGRQQVGGLVGFLQNGAIINGYAVGLVKSATTTDIGGLVGLMNSRDARLDNSYSIVEVAGDAAATDIGGLVGDRTDPVNTVVSNSYWDSQTSLRDTSDGGTGKTTEELQSPTTNQGIYKSWSPNDWDFGTALQYPRLRYVRGTDSDNPACYEDAVDMDKGLPRCGDVLLDQDNLFLLPPCTTSLIGTYTDTDNAIQVRDIDKDNNGLIEICDLEGLNAMRYQLDGTGYRASAGARSIRTGCPSALGGCRGYELARDVDFMDDASYRLTSTNKVTWTTGQGWEPIGYHDGGANFRDATFTFSGNSYTIFNLLINRPNDNNGVGFFRRFGGTIRSIRLSDVNVTGGDGNGGNRTGNGGLAGGQTSGEIYNAYVSGTIRGRNRTGGLVGQSNDTIRNSYAVVDVSGGSNQYVGGLVGYSGSLSSISESFAIATVNGQGAVGGLVGAIASSNGIRNSYARGRVRSESDGNEGIGGLVGLIESGNPEITNSYSIAEVMFRNNFVGGLIGFIGNRGSARINSSYWNSETSGQDISAGGTSKTTVELQSPATNEGIYANWSPDVWDFGSDKEYPVLRYGGRGTACNDTGVGLPKCGDVSPDQVFLPPRPCTASLSSYTDSDGVAQILDLDKDGDGLIEICDVEGLNEMRYQLDGTGYRASATAKLVTSGCPDGGCKGYELTRDLDFMADASYRASTETNKTMWTSGEGWEPVGGAARANFVFNGNGYTIANLLINRSGSSSIGFFGVFEGERIDNIRLKGVDVSGLETVGGLAGWNLGSSIRNVYISGTIRGRGNRVGGLVGILRGGSIINSYAEVRVIGPTSRGGFGGVGGLVGVVDRDGLLSNNFAVAEVSGEGAVGVLVGELGGTREIVNGYARGSAFGLGNAIGGLVGYIAANTAQVNDSYSIARSSGNGINIGGLVGQNTGDTTNINSSHWNTETSGQSSSNGGSGQTTMALQEPTAATGIYNGWTPANWDFGSAAQYPILKYIKGNDTANLACYEDIADMDEGLPKCGTFLPDQGSFLRSLKLSVGGSNRPLQQSFNSAITDYTVLVQRGDFDANLDITAIPYNEDKLSAFYYSANGAQIDFDANNLGQITLSRDTTLTIVVDEGTTSQTYSLNFMLPSIQGEIGGAFEVDERSRVNLTAANVSGGSRMYSYLWTQVAGPLVSLSGTTSPTLSFEIPADFIKSATSQTVMLRFNLRIRDNEAMEFNLTDLNISRTLTIRKIDNEPLELDLELRLDGSTLRFVNFDGDSVTDSDGKGTFVYRWQARDLDSGWTDIELVAVATSASYTIPQADPNSRLYRVRVAYSDQQGYGFVRFSQQPEFRRDIDIDDDGLIEIYYLEQLSAIRHVLDGSGYKHDAMTTKNTVGCRVGGCNGFELARNLDFDDDTSYIFIANKAIWTSDQQNQGWEPIEGSVLFDFKASRPFCRAEGDQCFSATFEGNGYTISNLHLRNFTDRSLNNRPRDVGLFAHTGEGSIINNIGLLSVDSRTDDEAVNFDTDYVGGLVGRNKAVITNAYVIGKFAGDLRSSAALVGNNTSDSYTTITSSYVHYDYTEAKNASNLSGLTDASRVIINNSYARGRFPEGSYTIGDLSTGGGSITNRAYSPSDSDELRYSYAIANFPPVNLFYAPNNQFPFPPTNYWADPSSSTAITALKSPTAPGETRANVYYDWSTEQWDFGTSAQFPVLKYAQACVDPQVSTVKSVTGQPICGTLLPHQGIGLRDLKISTEQVILAPVFGTSTETNSYFIDFPAGTENIVLDLTAYNYDATITVVKQGAPDTDYFAGKGSKGQSEPIPTDGAVALRIMVSEAGDGGTTLYNVGTQNAEITTFENNTPRTNNIVDEGSEITLNSTVSGGSGNYNYEWIQTQGTPLMFPRNPTTSLRFRIPDDYIASATSTSTDIVIRFTLTDREFIDLPPIVINRTLTIRKKNNQTPELTAGVVTTETMADGIILRFDPTVINDSDGVSGNFSYRWLARSATTNWATVATDTDYTIAPGNGSQDRFYRIQLTHTDLQGYQTAEDVVVLDIRANNDIDIDDDGLIEIYYLEHLSAIRHQLDGTAYRIFSHATTTTSCHQNVCKGYELARSLDFADDDSYISTANKVIWRSDKQTEGWQPIGKELPRNDEGFSVRCPDGDSCFSAIFEGNGYTIANLRLRNWNNQRDIGLFSHTFVGSTIKNVGFLNVDSRQIPRHGDRVGVLVSRNASTVTNVYVNGATIEALNVGVLVGRNDGTITNSYTNYLIVVDNLGSRVTQLGGLVLENGSDFDPDPQINNSYALGGLDVSKLGFPAGPPGGTLQGASGGRLINSYGIDYTDTRRNVNGSFSIRRGVQNSYSLVDHSESDLRTPTSPTGIYSSWGAVHWDYGSPSQLPVLKYVEECVVGDSVADPKLSPSQPTCDALLPDQGVGLRDLKMLTDGGVELDLVPFFSESVQEYSVTFPYLNVVKLKMRAYDDHARIHVGEASTDTSYYSGRVNSLTTIESSLIPINAGTALVVTIDEPSIATTITTAYTINLVERLEFTIRLRGVVADDRIFDEGDFLTLTAPEIADLDSSDYGWTQISGKQLLPRNIRRNNRINVRFPHDFVESATATTANIVVRLEISRGDTVIATIDETLTVRKRNNQIPVLDQELTINGSNIMFDETLVEDSDGAGSFVYQWQRRDLNQNWVNIASTSSVYTVGSSESDFSIYRVEVGHTDAQGYQTTPVYVTSVGFRKDVDSDNDGLIDIFYLEHLDAVRYDLDGTHYTLESGVSTNTGCFGSCNGYELLRALDFNDDASYILPSNKALWTGDGAGWQPIGDLANPFDARFTSTNTFAISNLFINRPDEDYIGLFGVSNGQISGLNLQNVDISGRFIIGGIAGVSLEPSMISDSSVDGTVSGSDAWVGGLVGVHDGFIVTSHARGEVIGNTSVGGLAGYALGPIADSYAHSNIKSQAYGGGLVGYHQGGQGISDSYASGSVEGIFYVGGLVGYNEGGVITNGYALGDVVGGTNVGGLVGYNDGGIITASAGVGNVLGANDVGDLAGSVNGGSITIGTMTPDRGDIVVGKLLALQQLTLLPDTLELEPPFDPSVDEYEIFDISGSQASQVQITAMASTADAVVTIRLDSQPPISMNGQASLTAQVADLTTKSVIVVTLTASSLTALGQATKTYTITRPAQPDLTADPLTPCDAMNRDLDNDGLMEICSIEGLYAMRYPESLSMPVCGENSTGTCIGYELAHDLDFDTDASYRTTANRVIFSEGRGWHPIGTFASPFTAVFNANNHTIANLRIDRAHRDYVGLFAHIGANAKLEDIGLADAYVRGRSVVGALVGSNTSGTIINSYTSNVATTTLVVGSGIRVGGLVGDHKGIVEHGSYTSGVVRGNRSVGGLVGYFSGLGSGENASDYGIINSYAESAVHGRVFTGGLVGSNINRIVNSYAIGDVASIFHAGGLVGINGGTIENTYAISDVGGQEIVGGLVGENEGLIANSYASGTVSGQSLIGELVGNNSGTIRYSYAVGDQSLIGLDSDGTTINSIVVVNLAELQESISEWDEENAWSFEDGKYPALRYTTSTTVSIACESDRSCGQLLGGQYPSLGLVIGSTSDTRAVLVATNPLRYQLIVSNTASMVMLIPTVDNSTTMSYSIGDGNFTSITSGSPFIVSGTDQTAAIRLASLGSSLADSLIRTVDYIVFLEVISPIDPVDPVDPVVEGIKLRIKVFLEGPLQ